MNEQLEIGGDAREEIRAELEAEAQAREDAAVEAHYQDWKARQKNLPTDFEQALHNAGRAQCFGLDE